MSAVGKVTVGVALATALLTLCFLGALALLVVASNSGHLAERFAPKYWQLMAPLALWIRLVWYFGVLACCVELLASVAWITLLPGLGVFVMLGANLVSELIPMVLLLILGALLYEGIRRR